MACFLKAESIGKLHGLAPLFFEVGLLQPGVGQATCRISHEVFQCFRTARMAAHDLIQKETVLTGEMLQPLLAAREALYLQIDGTFAIELAIEFDFLSTSISLDGDSAYQISSMPS